jgi:dipeptidyl aminopeptidase/acylaminoacyl peptidase
VIVFVLFVLAACGGPAPTLQATNIAQATVESTLRPTSTPAPTNTATPTATPTNTPTPTPTPNPLNIEWLRQQSYPGSDITIEQELPRGSNYRQYIASYESEGLKIYGLLTIPDGEKPATGWPAIIFNHGFIPPNIYRTTERYVAYVDAIARSGYVVFKPDYRGHGNSEGEATGGYASPAYTVDVLNALASVKKLPEVDPNRIGMWGHSMGGMITLRSMVVSKDIKAGVIWGGVVASYADLLTKWRRPQSEVVATPPPGRRWRTEFIETYGTPEENPDFWNSISPITFVSDISGPVQLDHSTTDEEVPIEFSESLDQALLDAG